jgi:sarcosine oxidase
MRVAVIGCGAMGAAAAWRLARRGADVACFDRYSPPHDRGSTHGDTRITRTAYFEGAWYVPLLQETFPMWRELERSTQTDLLTITGLLTLGRPDSESIVGALAAARQHRLETRVLDSGEVRRLYPAHVVADDEIAVFDPQAGFVRPEAALVAMLQGLDVRRQTPVIELKTRPDGVEVVTSGGAEKFDAAVLATGPWIAELGPVLPVTVERQVMVWLALQSGSEQFSPARFPVWLREDTPHGDLYGFPSLDGGSIKLGRHHGGEAVEANSVRRVVTDADLDPLRLFVTTYLRGVTRSVTRSAVCMYTNTPDQHFVIDMHPEAARVVVVSACSGHGFKFSPVVGDIAADLVLDGGTQRDIARFSITRFAGSRS